MTEGSNGMTQFYDRTQTLPAIEADLFYLARGIERPRSYVDEPPPGETWSTAVHEGHRTAIRDMRPIAGDVSLDREGFALIEAETQVGDFTSDKEVRTVYYPEVEAVLRARTGAGRVFIFDHTVRRRIEGAQDRREGAPRQPVPRVHVDHTARSGPQNVRDRLGEEAEALLRGRVRIVNLWRPIKGPVIDAPLAVCDAGSVAFSDLVPSDLVYRHRVGETYAVTHNPAHRWFYVPRMMPGEALLLKCFDSETDGRARFAPHTAFELPNTPAGTPPRESIEVRALLFG